MNREEKTLRISIAVLCGAVIASRLVIVSMPKVNFPDFHFPKLPTVVATTTESANENDTDDVTVETETEYIVEEPLEEETEIITFDAICIITEIVEDKVTIECDGQSYEFYGNGYTVGQYVNCTFTSKNEVIDAMPIETETEEPTEPTYWCEWLGEEISLEDYELLCRTTYCESGGEPLEVQIMICLVILNQYHSPKFADTIHGVVYAKNAFEVTTWKDFEEREWNAKTEIAVQKALAENPYPRDMFYFRTGHYHKWADDYRKVGKVYFSTHPN